jgi:hypothetical protein
MKQTKERVVPVTVPAVEPVTSIDLYSPPTSGPLALSNLRAAKKLTVDVTSISKIGELVMCCEGELMNLDMPSKYHPEGHGPAICIEAHDVARNEHYIVVCNAIMASSLRRAGQPLVGRYFAVRVGELIAGKRYRQTEVVELERVE